MQGGIHALSQLSVWNGGNVFGESSVIDIQRNISGDLLLKCWIFPLFLQHRHHC